MPRQGFGERGEQGGWLRAAGRADGGEQAVCNIQVLSRGTGHAEGRWPSPGTEEPRRHE